MSEAHQPGTQQYMMTEQIKDRIRIRWFVIGYALGLLKGAVLMLWLA